MLSVARLASSKSKNSVVFGDQWILKLFRRVESGVNPDFEIGMFLAGEEPRFSHTPAVLESNQEYRVDNEEITRVGILHRYIPNTITAWQFAP